MKHNTITGFLLMLVIVMMGACGEGSAYDELPSPIAKFVSEYFPFGEVTGYNTSRNGSSVVTIRHGATLTFDSVYEWIDVNGNGATLPPQFLYDQLPPTLYDYILSLEDVNDVYRCQRDSTKITVELLENTLYYDLATQTITTSDPKSGQGVTMF
ncbi:MAG: hypothetical protein NC111_05650 [Bacteroides sp.]|nr:hypothetical protein [Bacteroides sp.]MCM1413320.1 hypothetical protein [Bacteroides sp.]MCM1471994.1 hypothetical protein [Bacteroides sp.]